MAFTGYKIMQFEKSKNCCDSKNVILKQIHIKLTHYQMTNFKLFQTERVCRRQFQV